MKNKINVLVVLSFLCISPLLAQQKDVSIFPSQNQNKPTITLTPANQKQNISIKPVNQPAKMDPKDEEAEKYFNKAMKESNLDKVVEYLTKSIELEPRYIPAHLYRGIAHFYNKQTDKAMADFQQVLKMDGKNVVAIAYLGKVYEAKNQDQAALGQYDKAIKQNNKYPDVYYWKGLLLNKMGKNGCKDLKEAKSKGFKVPDSDLAKCK